MPPPLSAHHVTHYVDQIDCHLMHDVDRRVTHDLNRHAHRPPHPTLTAASHHFDCTPSRTPHMSQLDFNRNPTTSPLPSLRDVGACNHNQQVLSARSNEGRDGGQTKRRVRRRRACRVQPPIKADCIPHADSLVLSGPPAASFEQEEGGTTVTGQCTSHIPPRLRIQQPAPPPSLIDGAVDGRGAIPCLYFDN